MTMQKPKVKSPTIQVSRVIMGLLKTNKNHDCCSLVTNGRTVKSQ